MNRFEKKAMLKKYPFLKDCVPHGITITDDVNTIFVEKGDISFLSKIPETHYYDGSLGVTRSDEIISFVLPNGSVKYNVVKQKGSWGSNYAHESSEEWKGESILEAVDRLQAFPRYVVIFYDYHNCWEGSECSDETTLTIVKLPNSNIVKRHIRGLEKALKEVGI